MAADLKLFVLGESSGNPAEWAAWGERVLVLASSPEEALSLYDGFDRVAEVVAESPVVLCHDAPSNGL